MHTMYIPYGYISGILYTTIYTICIYYSSPYCHMPLNKYGCLIVHICPSSALSYLKSTW